MDENKAKAVIAKFGGQNALAGLLKKGQSTVQHWSKTGVIPAKWHGPLLDLAVSQKIELSANDLLNANVASDVQALPAEFETVAEGDEVKVDDIKTLPVAKLRGLLNLIDVDIPAYVLDDGQRVVGRTSMTEMLTGIKGGGALEQYLRVSSLKPFINLDLVLERMISFRIPEVEGLGKAVKGLPADVVIEVCRGFMSALEATQRESYKGEQMTLRQMQIAIRAGMFVGACAKVGLDALIDEVTGNQYERAEDALQVKLRAYLEKEMRTWERTFPPEIWVEFGRLTGWSHSVTKRPKYWGKLVMELVYEYLDPDVAKWLKANAPTPRHGQNYHQWLSSQFGLKKLVEHIWLLIGVAKTCRNIRELKDKMAEMFGKVPVQYTFYLPQPKA